MRYSQVGSLAFTLAGVVAGCLAGASATLPSSRAAAQELDFESGEAAAAAPAAKAAPAAAAPAEGPPSEALANGLRLYKEERYPEASVQFQRIVEGETRDAAGNKQKAQFFLAKSLYHLKYYQSALAIFDEISQMGKGHIYYDQTLQWLAQLASQLLRTGIEGLAGVGGLAAVCGNRCVERRGRVVVQVVWLAPHGCLEPNAPERRGPEVLARAQIVLKQIGERVDVLAAQRLQRV